jgi:hypothetical protein
MLGPVRATARVFEFHLRVGARVALRALVAATAAAAGSLILLGPDFVQGLAMALFRDPSLASALLPLGAAAGVARVAAARVVTGLGGWLRHLPVSGATHRRAATARRRSAQGRRQTGGSAVAGGGAGGGSSRSWRA